MRGRRRGYTEGPRDSRTEGWGRGDIKDLGAGGGMGDRVTEPSVKWGSSL